MTSIFPTETSRAIEKELDEYFNDAIARSREIGTSYERLWISLYDLIKSGGKRFRPNITILAYEIFGGTKIDGVVPIAASQELLHLCLLIHDDIIDRDYIRHGVPNIAGRYRAFYQKHIPIDADITHFAHSAALLGGDLMLAGAHELIAKSEVTAEQKRIAHSLLAKSVFDVAGGELLDTEASFLAYAPGDALKVALYKTAGYSFVSPLLTGAKLAHISNEQEHYLRDYANALGIAYQLVDDLLGVFGDEKTTGKSILGDIREGKKTFLVEQAMADMSTNDKILFNLAFGNPRATSESIHQAKELLISSGGKQKTEQVIADYHAKALGAVVNLGLDDIQQDKLKQLADMTIGRDY